jgi:hypothetical protein
MTIKVEAHPARLQWSHFKRVAHLPGGSDEEAQTSSEIILPTRISQRKVGSQFQLGDFTVTVGIKAHETLVVRSAATTDDLLDHEQGHFDLLLLVARAMAAELEKATGSSSTELQSAVSDIQSTHNTRAQALDATYDDQTHNSRNETQQRRWRKLIDDALGKQGVMSLDGNDL